MFLLSFINIITLPVIIHNKRITIVFSVRFYISALYNNIL